MCESRVWLPRWAPLRTLLPRPRSGGSRLPPARLPLPRALGPATLRRCPTPRPLVPVFQAGDAANADFPGSALRTRPFPSSQLSCVTSRKQLPASELDCPANFLGCRVGSPGYLPPLPGVPRAPSASCRLWGCCETGTGLLASHPTSPPYRRPFLFHFLSALGFEPSWGVSRLPAPTACFLPSTQLTVPTLMGTPRASISSWKWPVPCFWGARTPGG